MHSTVEHRACARVVLILRYSVLDLAAFWHSAMDRRAPDGWLAFAIQCSRIGVWERSDCAHPPWRQAGRKSRGFEVDGKRYGHILDPRTGYPTSGVASVSVIADSAARADSLSTAFFIGGTDLAKRYCDQHEGVVAIILEAHDSSHPIIIGSCDRVSVETSE